MAEAMLCLDDTPWAGLAVTEPEPQRFLVSGDVFGLRIGVSDVLDQDRRFDANHNRVALQRMADFQGAIILEQYEAQTSPFGHATFVVRNEEFIALASAQRLGARRYIAITLARGTSMTPDHEAAHAAALTALQLDPTQAHRPCIEIITAFVCYGNTQWEFVEELTTQGQVVGVQQSDDTGAELLVFAIAPDATPAEIAAVDLIEAVQNAASREATPIAAPLPFDVPSAASTIEDGLRLQSYVVVADTLLLVDSRLPIGAGLPALITLHQENLTMIRETP